MVRRRALLALGAALLVAVAAGCGDAGSSNAAAGRSSAASGAHDRVTVRLGYFPNLTHATAIVGVEKGLFAESLGTDELETKLFNAGPAAVEALFAGAIDAAYMGPNPAINAFVQSQGKAVRIVAGATSGGASLVVKPEINSAAELRGKKVATPQLGNTQDVALRAWLKSQGLKTDAQGGGDVSILPQENAQTLEAFKSNAISGAWVPEPWATRLVQEGGGETLVDEKSLWPNGQFVTTHLVVSTDFANKHPEAVRELIEGQVAANQFIAANADDAKKTVNDALVKYTGKGIAPAVIDAAWKNLTFTNDPVASSLFASAQHAQDLGLLKSEKLDGIYDLTVLNDVLKQHGLQEVSRA
jgi:NitT/TauT family transport system substrate-binding protein